MARRRSGGSGEVSMEIDRSALDRAVRSVPGDMRSNVDGALRKLGDRVVSDARRKVKSGPSRNTGKTRSRQQAAAGIDFRVRDGQLRLESDGSRLPPERRGFPAFYGMTRWTHPVFGGRAKVTQRGQPFWAPSKYQDEARRELEKSAQRALDKAG